MMRAAVQDFVSDGWVVSELQASVRADHSFSRCSGTYSRELNGLNKVFGLALKIMPRCVKRGSRSTMSSSP